MGRRNTVLAVLVGVVSALSAVVASPVHADSTDGDIFYTTFSGTDRVFSRSYSFDGTTLTYGTENVISSTTDGLGGADGLVFDPTDPNYLLVGGQNTFIYRVNIASGAVTSSSSTSGSNFHLAITPDGNYVLGSSIPGSSVSQIDLTPFNSSLTNLSIIGDDTTITGIAFDGAGNMYYTNAAAGGTGGNFGTAILGGASITTTQLATGIDAHGIAFDSFTGDIFLFGDDQINQYNIIGDSYLTLDLGNSGLQFDQGTIDGKGHLFVASNSGHMLFVDYSGTGDISDGSNVQDLQFFRADLDDVAPLSGQGSREVVPEPASMVLFGFGGIGAAFVRRRRKLIS